MTSAETRSKVTWYSGPATQTEITGETFYISYKNMISLRRESPGIEEGSHMTAAGHVVLQKAAGGYGPSSVTEAFMSEANGNGGF